MPDPKRLRGRPKKDPSNLLVQKAIRMTRFQWEKVAALGLPRLREHIENLDVSNLKGPTA